MGKKNLDLVLSCFALLRREEADFAGWLLCKKD